MMSSSCLRNILIAGAGGQIGGDTVEELLKQGKYNIAALTRSNSTSIMPERLHTIVKADYDAQDEFVAAMKGKDVLVITTSAMRPAETSVKLIDPAALAGVRYDVPDE